MMKKIAIPLSLIAAATLAACGGPAYVQPAASAAPYYVPAGNQVTSMPPNSVGKIVYLVDPTGPIDGISWQRMWLEMPDGSRPVIDVRGHQYAKGETIRFR